MATVSLGADIRRWITYELKDLTAEEAEVLSHDEGEGTIELLHELVEQGRAVESHYHDDDNPDLFAGFANPAVFGFDPEEES